MRTPEQRENHRLVGLSSAGVALILAIIGGYLSLDRRVSDATTTAQVEHIIDLKTGDKLDEIIRRLQHIDTQIERLQNTVPHATMTVSKEK
jgi:hypothetical protein